MPTANNVSQIAAYSMHIAITESMSSSFHFADFLPML
jgi:hypothetical protein